MGSTSAFLFKDTTNFCSEVGQMQGKLGNVVSSYILSQNIIKKERRKMATDVKLAVYVTGGYILSMLPLVYCLNPSLLLYANWFLSVSWTLR